MERWSDVEGEIRDRLVGRVEQALLEPFPGRDLLHPFVDRLLRAGGDQIAALLAYGSCLFDETRTSTSFPDFYVLVDDLDAYHASRWHALLNRVLPPNVYYAAFASDPGRPVLRCKYCVMSLRQFARETSPRASDIYHLGRFSKRIALAHSRDPAATRIVCDGNLGAMWTLLPRSLSLLSTRFDLDELILRQLGLSYVGEQRVNEPDKVHKLMRGALPFYREVYADLLDLYARRAGHPRRGEDGRYEQPPPRASERRLTEQLLRRSRLRGVLRWPKYIATVDDWVDYLLAKLERHHGVQVELTPLQRRHPLIFAWPVYFEMRRRGIVK